MCSCSDLAAGKPGVNTIQDAGGAAGRPPYSHIMSSQCRTKKYRGGMSPDPRSMQLPPTSGLTIALIPGGV